MDSKCSVCGGSECELGKQCKNTCKDCFYPTFDDRYFHGECPSFNNSKVISLQAVKESKMQMDEKLSQILGSNNFICFYFDDTGNINISKTDMPNFQLSYIKQIMTMITDDQFRSTINWKS